MTNSDIVPIRRALISVSDKTGIVDFAKWLVAHSIEIVSTGGTAKLLRESAVPVKDVSDVTNFPEIMDGRVKTLHPIIHGGILGKRDQHAAIATTHSIPWFDLVVVNLYPFAETTLKKNVTQDDAIENIDVGGPTMIRAAAKNMAWVTVVVDPADYSTISEKISQGIDFEMRKQLAAKAFAYTAQYDQLIHDYLSNGNASRTLHLEHYAELRYGENPHQKATAYQFTPKASGILAAKQHQGKPLSFNNITDADAAAASVREFSQAASVIVKHGNPCGVAIADTIFEAFQAAFQADALSAFGGVVALNRPCDHDTAKAIAAQFLEVVIAPDFTQDALTLLTKKPNLRLLQYDVMSHDHFGETYTFIDGGVLVQERDGYLPDEKNLSIVTKTKPDADAIKAMLFAWRILKHMKSNAILIASSSTTLGMGAGQVSRVDAVDMALQKAFDKTQGAILASDAFFPFRDSIDRLAGKGISAIIQPGGSLKDNEVIAACDEQNIAMVFTGKRCFKH